MDNKIYQEIEEEKITYMEICGLGRIVIIRPTKNINLTRVI